MNAFVCAISRVLIALMLGGAMIAASTVSTLAAGGQTGNLSGIAREAGTRLPISGAAVDLVSASGRYKATTDTRGFFQITGATLDTYSLSIQKSGYESYLQEGITLSGDQTVDLGQVSLSKSIRTIARTSARASTSAFQPTQTVDSYTFSGAKLDEALGKKFNTNQAELVSSAPSVQVDTLGNLSVRGGLTDEIGQQLDGVDNTQVSHSRISTGFLNGIGSLSVVPGAGDPSQGNAGAGVVNLIPKRGTNPPFGLLDAEVGSGAFYHQLGFEYGWASPNGRFSSYTSFTGVRQSFQEGPPGTPAALIAPAYYTGPSYQRDNDFLNNSIYKFGKNNHESLQLLTQTRFTAIDADLGGYLGLPYGQFSPFAGYANPPLSQFGVTYNPSGGAANDTDLSNLLVSQRIMPLLPGQTSYTQTASGPTPATSTRSSYVKLEYDNNLNASTYLAARYYDVGYIGITDNPYGTQSSAGSFGLRTTNDDGGRRGGVSFELNKTLGERNAVTFGAKYEIARPAFSFTDYSLGLFDTENPQRRGTPDIVDYFAPRNVRAPLTFPTLSPTGAILSPGSNDCPIVGGCWLYYTGKFPNGVSNPPLVLDSPPNPVDYYAYFIRDQVKVSDRLRLDLGLREDGANFHVPSGIVTGNVDPNAESNTPRYLEPRAAAAFQATRRDSFRFSYGRSIEYLPPAGLYTPTSFLAYNGFANVPVPDPATNADPNVRAGRFSPVGAVCGSGEDLGQSGPLPVPLRSCTNYADFLHWEMDNLLKPDFGNAITTTYSNLEFSYSHLFGNGFAVKLTPFYKRGFNVPLLSAAAYSTDPITGELNPISYRNAYNGISKTTGIEMLLTSPDRLYGFSGFLSATYINELTNKPAGSSSEDATPVVSGSVFQSGNIYRVGFLARSPPSPVSRIVSRTASASVRRSRWTAASRSARAITRRSSSTTWRSTFRIPIRR